MPRLHAARVLLYLATLALPAVVSGQTADDGAATSQLLDRKLASDLVPGPVEFYVLLPPGYSTAGERYPLVIDLHGYSRTGTSQKSGSGWAKVADRENFLVAYPDGVGSSWNVGGCCGTAGNANVDDVGFIKALVKKLTAEACVDPERVFASGVSNGAGMAGRLSCDAADVIAQAMIGASS